MPNLFNGSPLGSLSPQDVFGNQLDFNQINNSFQNLTDKFNLLQYLYNNRTSQLDTIQQTPVIGQDLISNLNSTISQVTPYISSIGKPTMSNNLTRLMETSLNSKELSDLKHQQNLSKVGNTMSIIGATSDIVSNFMPQKTEYSGTKGDLAQTLDATYDGISDVAMSLGPIGTIVGGTMKAGSLLNKGLNTIGGGTDGMTNIDSILGSSFLGLTPLGLINGFGGQKTDTITKDTDSFAQVGSSYTGTNSLVNDALKKSGKKYGLFSQNARNKANNEIYNAKNQQQYITDIADNAMNRFNIRNSMSAINGNRRRYNLQGGYQQIQFGRNGFALQDLYRARKIIRTHKYQQGGTVIKNTSIIEQPKDLTESERYKLFFDSLPKNLQDTTDYRMQDYWKYNGMPKDFKEAVLAGIFTQHKDGWHAYSVAENPKTGEIEFMKSSKHPSLWKELNWYYSNDGANFRKEYDLIKTEPYYKYVKKSIQNTTQPETHKKGGQITLHELQFTILPNSFGEGGKFNVIPEGALHARKHNMNVEGITKKGIPVVSESDGGKVEQQAEIEREELILRLEVTKKIEELYKEYFKEDTSQKEKDNLAIQAGKLLTKEILYNTKDNTNNSI